MSIAALNRVVLTKDLPEDRLAAGDVGTVVHVYPSGEAFEVEIFSLTGRTLAVATVAIDALRPVAANDVASARTVAAE